jgi:hypothetical protein
MPTREIFGLTQIILSSMCTTDCLDVNWSDHCIGIGVTQVSSETVADNVGVNKSVLKLITNDTIVGIVSAEEFTPGTAISGFATIYKGITLSTAISSNKFVGTATDADKLGGIAAANYLRSDTFDTMNDRLTISSDDGLVIGAGSDLTITVGGVSGTDVTFANTSSNGDIIFTVNDGGVTKEVLRMDGAAGRIDHLRVGDLTVDGTQTIINTTTLSVEDNIIELNRNVSSNAGMPNYTGLKVNRGSISSATEQALYWVWDETFSDDGRIRQCWWSLDGIQSGRGRHRIRSTHIGGHQGQHSTRNINISTVRRLGGDVCDQGHGGRQSISSGHGDVRSSRLSKTGHVRVHVRVYAIRTCGRGQDSGGHHIRESSVLDEQRIGKRPARGIKR